MSTIYQQITEKDTTDDNKVYKKLLVLA